MCSSMNCSKRDGCIRATCSPNPYYQSYADFSVECENNDYKYHICKVSREDVKDILVRC